MTSEELKYAFSQIACQQFCNVTTLFLHSFSLLKWFRNPEMPKKNESGIRKLHFAAEFVAKAPEFYYISENDIDSITINNDVAMKSEIIWKSNFKGMLYTYLKAKRIANRNKKARLLLWVARVGGLCFLAIIIALALCL